MNRRRCEICNIEVHRASYCRHLRSEKHAKNELKVQMERVGKFINTDRFTINGIEINLDRDRINRFYSKLDIRPDQ